jgi:hypothetical protein
MPYITLSIMHAVNLIIGLSAILLLSRKPFDPVLAWACGASVGYGLLGLERARKLREGRADG